MLFTVEVKTTGQELLITQVITTRSDLFTVEVVTQLGQICLLDQN